MGWGWGGGDLCSNGIAKKILMAAVATSVRVWPYGGVARVCLKDKEGIYGWSLQGQQAHMPCISTNQWFPVSRGLCTKMLVEQLMSAYQDSHQQVHYMECKRYLTPANTTQKSVHTKAYFIATVFSVFSL